MFLQCLALFCLFGFSVFSFWKGKTFINFKFNALSINFVSCLFSSISCRTDAGFQKNGWYGGKPLGKMRFSSSVEFKLLNLSPDGLMRKTEHIDLLPHKHELVRKLTCNLKKLLKTEYVGFWLPGGNLMISRYQRKKNIDLWLLLECQLCFELKETSSELFWSSVINRGWDFQKFITFSSRLIKFNGKLDMLYLLSNCQNIYLTGARFTPFINKWSEIYDRKTTDLLLKRAINLTWRDF